MDLVLTFETVALQILVCILGLFPEPLDRSLLYSSFRENVAAGQRVERSPRDLVLENLFANAVKEMCLTTYLGFLLLLVVLILVLPRLMISAWF